MNGAQANTGGPITQGLQVGGGAIPASTPVDNTLAIRISRLEARIEQAEGKMQTAEHIYTVMINEVNSLREQCGMPSLDHSYYQP